MLDHANLRNRADSRGASPSYGQSHQHGLQHHAAGASERGVKMRRMTTLAAGFAIAIAVCAVALELQARRAHAAPVAARSDCRQECLSAYQAIARALKHDPDNVVAPAIVQTPGFSYGVLERVLGIPTGEQIRARWRASCDARFANRPATATLCYGEIVRGQVVR